MDSSKQSFKDAMLRLGVKPIDEDGPSVRKRQDQPPQHAPEQDVDSDDHALFLEAMAELNTAPNKDARSASPRDEGFRKLKSLKNKQIELEDCLDLHGKKTVEALALLRAFITRAFTHNIGVVVVITGKGKHSPGQRGVLRGQVEQWILGEGKRFIRAYAEAPRAHGGAGAFILYIRKH